MVTREHHWLAPDACPVGDDHAVADSGVGSSFIEASMSTRARVSRSNVPGSLWSAEDSALEEMICGGKRSCNPSRGFATDVKKEARRTNKRVRVTAGEDSADEVRQGNRNGRLIGGPSTARDIAE